MKLRRVLLVASLVLVSLWISVPLVDSAATTPTLHKLALPTLAHPLGTDALGRDIAARLIVGAPNTLVVVSGAILLSLLLAGVFALPALIGTPPRDERQRTWQLLDVMMIRFADMLRAVPRVLLVIALVGLVAGTADDEHALVRLALVLGITGWMPLARLLRDLSRAARVERHVQAAEALGLPPLRVFAIHVLPAVWPGVIVWLTASMAELILLETGLSFLGVGIPVTMVSWGTVLRDVGDLFGNSRWLMLGPGLVIGCAVAGIQWASDRLVLSLRPLKRNDTVLNESIQRADCRSAPINA